MRDYNWPRILKLIVKESLTDDRVWGWKADRKEVGPHWIR